VLLTPRRSELHPTCGELDSVRLDTTWRACQVCAGADLVRAALVREGAVGDGLAEQSYKVCAPHVARTHRAAMVEERCTKNGEWVLRDAVFCMQPFVHLAVTLALSKLKLRELCSTGSTPFLLSVRGHRSLDTSGGSVECCVPGCFVCVGLPGV